MIRSSPLAPAASRWLRLAFALACGLSQVACHRKHDAHASGKNVATHPKESATMPQEPAEGSAELSHQIEVFTGAHTKLVWNECQNRKLADPMSISDDQLLQGIDTADGRGVRAILPDKDNYSRPLLSPDGNAIIYTRKVIKPKGRRNLLQLTIMRTDWQGSKPTEVGDGYAVDVWRDPQTKRIWVIAVRDPQPSRQKTFDAETLVRIPLDGSGKAELLWDQTPLSPDNIQLSRDGMRACALLPWPAGGIIDFHSAAPAAKEYTHGCWPSQSPDNSYVSWVFNGDHKSATFFDASGTKSWEVRFNAAPHLQRGEVYHPRWSNHPRFLVLTGPYRGINGGGGRGANVHLCRLSEKLDSVEAILQVVDNKLSQSFPAAWIDGGDKVDTPGFSSAAAPPTPTAPTTAMWPTNSAGLVFLWKDRPSLNSFKGSDGRTHTTQVDTEGLAHSGRHQEVALESGTLRATDETAAFAVSALTASGSASFEAIVLPSLIDASAKSVGRLLSSPRFVVGVRDEKLLVLAERSAWEGGAPLPSKPFHLAVSVTPSGATAWVDGEAQPLHAAAPPSETQSTNVEFGVGWNGGLLHLAIYDRPLDEAEAKANAAAARVSISKFAPQPTRVSLMGKLLEISAVPSAESIAPYRSSLVNYVYEVEKVISGELTARKVLVQHWGLLNLVPIVGFSREIGKTYRLTIEREADHPELKGERVSDDTTAFDLDPWLDVGPPGTIK